VDVLLKTSESVGPWQLYVTLAMAVQRFLDKSRMFVQTWGSVIDEHKTVLWLIGTASSGLAGWAVYSARRLHYQQIQSDMSAIVGEIHDIKEAADKNDRRSADDKLDWWRTPGTYLVLAPAVCSAFLFGYITGRAYGSYKFTKQMHLKEGLRQNKVYIAVIPEQLFDSNKLAASLEKAVSEASRAPSRSWSDAVCEDLQKRSANFTWPSRGGGTS